MRILVDLASHISAVNGGGNSPLITQVEVVPETDEDTPINGRYSIPTIKGVEMVIPEDAVILNGAGQIDGSDICSAIYANLLAMFPMFDNVYFNPLLTPDHVNELDFTKTFKDVSTTPAVFFPSRFQTGREPIGPGQALDPGQMPTHTALLPANTLVTPTRPGMMITDLINIGPYTLDKHGNQVGADEFMVYWKLYEFNVTQDITADYGANSGTNTPAIRNIVEIAQEPTGFSAYISTDDGANWCQVGLIEPIAFCDKTKSFRLAFRNDSANKVFIAAFAVLF